MELAVEFVRDSARLPVEQMTLDGTVVDEFKPRPVKLLFVNLGIFDKKNPDRVDSSKGCGQ